MEALGGRTEDLGNLEMSMQSGLQVERVDFFFFSSFLRHEGECDMSTGHNKSLHEDFQLLVCHLKLHQWTGTWARLSARRFCGE